MWVQDLGSSDQHLTLKYHINFLGEKKKKNNNVAHTNFILEIWHVLKTNVGCGELLCPTVIGLFSVLVVEK
jgi:hypothetical protein